MDQKDKYKRREYKLPPFVSVLGVRNLRRFRNAVLWRYGLLLRRRILRASPARAGASTGGAARIRLLLVLLVLLGLLVLVSRALIHRRCAGTLASGRGARLRRACALAAGLSC